MTDNPPLKELLLHPGKVADLAGWLKAADPGFDAAGFTARVLTRLGDLELKARISWISQVLDEFLPADFAAAADIIESALPPPLDPTLTDNDHGDFILAPFGDYAARHGTGPGNLDRAIALLHALTRRFSMEFAIRRFLIRHKARMLAVLAGWTQDPHYHVRRLVSEGTRPLLPWAERIGWAPADTIPLLDALHADRTRLVTRSVANHLNDIAKADPAVVIATLTRWREDARQDPAELDWMTRHALRTLIKQGHPGALAMIGYHPDPDIDIGPLVLDPADGKVAIGGTLRLAFDITARAEEPLLVDYGIGFLRASGKTSEKVFKLKQLTLRAGETVRLSKRYTFRANSTTVRLHPGRQSLFVQINGKRVREAAFDLAEP